jgi:hypothetical protein
MCAAPGGSAHSHDHYEETIYSDGLLTWTVDRKQTDVVRGRTSAYVEAAQVKQPKPQLFAQVSDTELLSYGVPPEGLNDVRKADEGPVTRKRRASSGGSAEALLNLATSVWPWFAGTNDHPEG